MKKILFISLIIAVLSVLIIGLLPAAAQEEDTEITVSSTAPLMVNGIFTEKFPVTVDPGTLVAIVDDIYYTSEGERWNFKGWSNGSDADSITLNDPGTYVAIWSREIHIQISSPVATLNDSMWLPYNNPLELSVPELVTVGTSLRYRFAGWSGGETPYLTRTIVTPFKPMVLEAKYTREFLFTIVAPEGIGITGSGWYAEDTDLVVQAPTDVYDEAGTSRQHFASWESIGYPVMVVPNSTSAVTTFKIDGAYTIRANYDKQYLVIADSPFGKLKYEWIKENEEIQLEAPATIDIITDMDRYVFQRWTGMEGLVSPKVSGVVTAAVHLTAVYEHQYALSITGTEGGSGAGWYKAGSAATVSVPLTNQTGLFLVSRFTGFTGYSAQDNSIQVLVDSPTVITANYTNGVDLRVMGIAIGAVIILVFLFIWGFGRLRTRRG